MNKEILEYLTRQIRKIKESIKQMEKTGYQVSVIKRYKKDIKMLELIKKELEEKDIMNYANLKCEPAPVLDDIEKRYLKNVIRPFKGEVNYIVKWQSDTYKSRQFLHIDTRIGNIQLPYFEKDTMYKNMEPDKEYTLKELGIHYDK